MQLSDLLTPFLKNVLIYFDRACKKTVLENVVRVLGPGGCLVVSAAEGLGDLAEDLVRIEPWLYHRSREAV
jgi:chemotaxis protein methyltransferase CheR